VSRKFETHFEIVYPPVKILKDSIRSNRLEFDVVFVGRIEESKGVRQFLEASRSKGLAIAIGGVGELQKELEVEFPEVTFLGQVDGQSLMSRSRILVVPSLLNETFGRVALEGTAVGIPVLLSNRGGLREFKSRKGSVIIEVDPENIQDFASKIDFALTLGKNEEPIAAEWLEDHFQCQLEKFKSLVNKYL